MIVNRFHHIGEELKDPRYELLWVKSESTLNQYKLIIDSIKQSFVFSNIKDIDKLNDILHSYLITLLITSFIDEQNRTNPSPHFLKLWKFYPYQLKSLYPSDSYLDRLSNKYIYNWGGVFGSLSYFIHLNESINEYLTPSQILDISIKECHLYNQYQYEDMRYMMSKNILDIDEEDIYRYPLSILKHPDVSKGIELIENIRPLLKDILDWYLSLYNSKLILTPPIAPPLKSNEYYAYETLIKIGEVMLNKGLNQFDSLNSYSFIHNGLPSIWIEGINEILEIRDNVLYDFSKSNSSLYEMIYMDMANKIPYKKYNSLLTKCQYLLSLLYPPGGYNLALLITASTLLNKAFIKTHSSTKDRNIDGVIDLVYKTSVCLRKTNIKTLMMLGNNIKQIDESIKNIDEPIDIRDIYYGYR